LSCRHRRWCSDVLPDIDPLTLDSVFLRPGRNDPCSCGSDKKYKKCCSDRDEEAWRTVAQWRREAELFSTMLPKFNRPEEPE